MLEILKEPVGNSEAGLFNLPPKFDKKKYAAEWVESGQVEFKKQRQVIPQANATADGWEIWKAKAKDEPTVISTSGNKKFVLMCRPRIIQDQVNALCGNISKTFIKNEVQGATVAGTEKSDAGMLTNEQLKSGAGESFSEEHGDTQLNRLSVENHNLTAAEKT